MVRKTEKNRMGVRRSAGGTSPAAENSREPWWSCSKACRVTPTCFIFALLFFRCPPLEDKKTYHRIPELFARFCQECAATVCCTCFNKMYPKPSKYYIGHEGSLNFPKLSENPFKEVGETSAALGVARSICPVLVAGRGVQHWGL